MFEFRAWRPAEGVGAPQDLADMFTAIYADLFPTKAAHPRIQFELVDLRPGPFEADTVHGLVDDLARFLLGQRDPSKSQKSSSRFLFVGGARTLATPEPETAAQRSIKRDAEFYIRTLQNYDLAHYGHVGAADTEPETANELIQSALIGLLRHYQAHQHRARQHDSPPPPAPKDIATDFATLIRTARKTREFQYLGSVDKPGADPEDISPLWLLREIGLLYGFGKGSRPPPYSPDTRLAELARNNELTFDVPLSHSSYLLYAEMLGQTGDWADAFHADRIQDSHGRRIASGGRGRSGDALAQRSFKLARYELLRDMGRVLGQGSLKRLRNHATGKPILLIDDEFFANVSAGPDPGSPSDARENAARLHLPQRLALALECMGYTPAAVHIVPSTFIDAHIGLMQADQRSRLLSPPAATPCRRLDGAPASMKDDLSDYLAIVIDPESRHDTCGPVRVQRLHSWLVHRDRAPSAAGRDTSDAPAIPPLLAFSRKESSGYVQQCLNMGASAFVPKARPYQLIFALSRALNDERRKRQPNANASQFRIVAALKPHTSAKLLRTSGPSYIYGGLQSGGQLIRDRREARWIDRLPKADLHYHLGTAIPYQTVNILALNTAGHFLQGAPDASDDASSESGASPLLRRLAETLALCGRLEGALRASGRMTGYSRMELLAAAASAVVGPKRKLRNSAFGLGDAIVRHLVEHNDQCDDAHATALLVAMMAAAEPFSLGEEVEAFFTDLIALKPPLQAEFSPADALHLEMGRAREHFVRVACRWNGPFTHDQYVHLSRQTGPDFWSEMKRLMDDRCRAAHRRLGACLQRAFRTADDATDRHDAAVEWLKSNVPGLADIGGSEAAGTAIRTFPLGDYVMAPDVQDERGLQLYLRGADLLGASHLQYPENLWIAALAITHDNARQNIVYGEVRCETTGYTKAGMSAQDATELLRHGFNLASLYVAGRPLPGDDGHRMPLVRTNLLLAAKRHKDESKVRAVVQLLEAYLERRAPFADSAHSRHVFRARFGDTMPSWWRPCDVVGFDLSGDETRDQPWLRTVIAPLAARSSPVTIHAGEAANADSIWKAVYELNALRIGHGLRLHEDTALLAYCVREGICMEMCPNSNRYTNQIAGRAARDPDAAPGAPQRYEYPLLHYLSQGMEVSLGTDNRYLHPRDQQTLTSEYLTAAQLVGGLTRWQVLQIVKAGFKNAFLDKSEVRSLIEAVEEEIYRIVATEFG